jgi:pyruvate dehydrogenase E2 component (dihydrolipoamide acetyltransferase)
MPADAKRLSLPCPACRQYHNIDVNVAVNSPAGLMVPFVRDADRKGLLAISQEVKELAGKVRG